MTKGQRVFLLVAYFHQGVEVLTGTMARQTGVETADPRFQVGVFSGAVIFQPSVTLTVTAISTRVHVVNCLRLMECGRTVSVCEYTRC